MKYLFAILFSAFCYSANASLISFDLDNPNPTTGEQLLVDVVVNNLNPEAAELSFDIAFDDTSLLFDYFILGDDVLFSGGFGAIDTDLFSSGLLNAAAFWTFASDKPGTSFVLGQIAFNVLADLSPSFNVSNVFAADNNFSQIPSQGSTQVPLPATIFMFLVGLVAMRGLRR